MLLFKKKSPPGNKKMGKQNFSWKAVATKESKDPSLVTHFLFPYTHTDTKAQLWLLITKRDMWTICLTCTQSEEMLSNWCQQFFVLFWAVVVDGNYVFVVSSQAVRLNRVGVREVSPPTPPQPCHQESIDLPVIKGWQWSEKSKHSCLNGVGVSRKEGKQCSKRKNEIGMTFTVSWAFQLVLSQKKSARNREFLWTFLFF